MAAASPLASQLVPRSTFVGAAGVRLSSVTPVAAALKKSALSSSCGRFRLVARAAEGEGAAVDVVDAKDKESVDILPTGEWSQSFSMLNYEDLHAHYEKKDYGPVPQGPFSPILPDKSHGVVSGEWSESISFLSYEDLSSYFQQQIFKQDAKPDSLVAEVMQRSVRTAFPTNTVAEIRHHFDEVSGIPVVDENLLCVGMLTKEDLAKAGSDSALVKDIMSPPPVVMAPFKTVLYAAVLMLKNKVSRIPVVNAGGQVVGIVTRTDIFTVLEDME